MAVWRTRPVDQVPVIRLVQWRVFEVASDDAPERTRHFVGYNLTENEGRVSSPIKVYDQDAKCGFTHSGRRYELVGAPGLGSLDGLETWSRWKEINRITVSEDVSYQYVDQSEQEAV